MSSITGAGGVCPASAGQRTQLSPHPPRSLERPAALGPCERCVDAEPLEGATYAATVPSTVADIFTAAGASWAGVVRWGTPLAPPTPRTAPATGIYVVALTDQRDSCAGALAAAPISEAAVDDLLVSIRFADRNESTGACRAFTRLGAPSWSTA